MKYFKRYLPQIRLQEIGNEGQQVLSFSKVFIVGCGALGAPVAMYLAGAGVGKIIIADFDTIDITNLHRQVFYTEEQAGNSKVLCLSEKIKKLNSQIEVMPINNFINNKLLNELEVELSLIIDAADNPATTYMLDEWCHKNNIPLLIAGIQGWEAQIFKYYPGSVKYSDVFPRVDDTNNFTPCSISGITGPTASFASSIQGAEAIKILLGIDKKSSFLIHANLLTWDFNYLCPTI